MVTDITDKIKNLFPPKSAIEFVLGEIEDITDVCIVYKRTDGTMAHVSSDMTHTQAIGFCEVGKQITIEEMKGG